MRKFLSTKMNRYTLRYYPECSLTKQSSSFGCVCVQREVQVDPHDCLLLNVLIHFDVISVLFCSVLFLKRVEKFISISKDTSEQQVRSKNIGV